MRRLAISRVVATLGIVGAVFLGSARVSRAESVTMALEDLGKGTYRLEGHIRLNASPYEVWRVLTDYERISNFVSSLRKSAIKESSTEKLLLEQEALGREFIFTKRIRVILQVTELPYRRIIFEDTSHDDFTFYEGSWEIRPVTGGLDVLYRLSCQRKFMVPNALAKDALKKSATELLSEVYQEIVRRSKTDTSATKK